MGRIVKDIDIGLAYQPRQELNRSSTAVGAVAALRATSKPKQNHLVPTASAGLCQIK
jgi:hypothetical protein